MKILKRTTLFISLVMISVIFARASVTSQLVWYGNGDDPVKGEVKTYDLALEDQNGETLHMKDLEGKVVFINFWATWCPPCIVEMPDINELYKTLKDDDEVVFLLISLDRNFETAKRFLVNKGFDFDIYRSKGAIPNDFETRGIPTTFVLDKNGAIARRYVGAQNYNTDEFKKFLKELKG